MTHTRRGTVLVIVAGLSAILAALTMTFLLRVRSDVEENAVVLRETQARVMLAAGMQYIAETARLGWHTPGAPSGKIEEAFGWIDIRDGRAGPCNQFGERMFVGDPVTGIGEKFPAVNGKAARCPMYVMERPPFAVSTAPSNPIPAEPNKTWRELIKNTVPSPQRIAADELGYVSGNRTPVRSTVGISWFRVFRTGMGSQHRLATFIVTCGAGGTMGFKDWPEVQDESSESLFGSEEDFRELRKSETILWYEVEWNPAVCHNNMRHNDWSGGAGEQPWKLNPLGSAKMLGEDAGNTRQQAGTFLYIQRLFTEPSAGW
jgi:hypothetical protein